MKATLKSCKRFLTNNWSFDNIVPYLQDKNLISATLEINQRMKELEAEGMDICKVGFGESPFPIPQSVIDELSRQAGQNSYEDIQGIAPLRKEISNFLERRFGYEQFDADNIMLGIGSKTVFADIIRVLDCEVLLVTPSWVSYKSQCLIAQKDVKFLQPKAENNYMPTPEELEELCSKDPEKKRIMIFNSPNNPTGIQSSYEELEPLVPVLRKYGIIVISDEIYNLFYEEGSEPASFAHKDLYPEGTIVTNGLSKVVGGGGWRMGFGAFPEELNFIIPVMKNCASHYYSCVPAPIQYASIKAFEDNPEVDEYLSLCRMILDPLRKFVYEELTSYGANLVEPNASFYAYPTMEPFTEQMKEVYGIETGADMSRVLLEEFGVAVLDGSKFSREDSEFGMRLCLTAFDGTKALKVAKEYREQGKEIDQEFLKVYCDKVVEAIERLCLFMEKMN